MKGDKQAGNRGKQTKHDRQRHRPGYAKSPALCRGRRQQHRADGQQRAECLEAADQCQNHKTNKYCMVWRSVTNRGEEDRIE
jgi:hypothetical protein